MKCIWSFHRGWVELKVARNRPSEQREDPDYSLSNTSVWQELNGMKALFQLVQQQFRQQINRAPGPY